MKKGAGDASVAADLTALIGDFERALRAGNKTERTIEICADSARRLDTFLQERGLPTRALYGGRAELEASTTEQRGRADLDIGTGVWSDPEAGRAVRGLGRARAARAQAERTAQPGQRWRDRHMAAKTPGSGRTGGERPTAVGNPGRPANGSVGP
jgi:hypothetical protein